MQLTDFTQDFISRDNETFAKELAEEQHTAAINTDNFDNPDAYNGWISDGTLAEHPYSPTDFANADARSYGDNNTTYLSLNRMGGRGRGAPSSFMQHEPGQMDVDSQGFGAQ